MLGSGCAQTEKKLGRGLSNMFEVVRWGEMRRSMEQAHYFEDPDTASTTGAVRGFNKSISRVGVGIYEIVTAPLPPYTPVFTNYLAVKPQYPDNYKPLRVSDSMYDHDTALGFAGGDNASFFPGSRFNVFR
jgi:putative exosortase-associated protein (TIGR04073 family)